MATVKSSGPSALGLLGTLAFEDGAHGAVLWGEVEWPREGPAFPGGLVYVITGMEQGSGFFPGADRSCKPHRWNVSIREMQMVTVSALSG